MISYKGANGAGDDADSDGGHDTPFDVSGVLEIVTQKKWEPKETASILSCFRETNM